MLNDVFPHKVCINLDRRPDRWQRVQARFARHGLRDVQRFAAYDAATLSPPPGWKDPPGAYGCSQSHLAVVRDARDRQLPHLLIFEDDVVFAEDLAERFRANWSHVPPDWDMLYFGAIHAQNPVFISGNIWCLTKSYSTFAYVLRDSIYDAFIELNTDALTQVDHVNHTLQQRFRCYGFLPHLAWVELDYSDAQDRLINYWPLQESLVFDPDVLEKLYRETLVVIACPAEARARPAVRYLAEHYARLSPELGIVVVEQGPAPTLDPGRLPTTCHYRFLEKEHGTDHASAFDYGVEYFGDSRKYIIFNEAFIYVNSVDIRANLLLAQKYELVRPYQKIQVLDPAATRRVLQGEAASLDASDRRCEKPATVVEGCCIFRRAAFDAVGGWAGGEGRLAEAAARLSGFSSPNYALRLSPAS